MKRVAIPVVKGKLSEYFENCTYCEIFETEGDGVKSNETETPPADISKLPQWAIQHGVTDIVSHKLNRNIIKLFTKEKINLYLGIKIDTPEKLIESYLEGTLKSDEQIISELTSEKGII